MSRYRIEPTGTGADRPFCDHHQFPMNDCSYFESGQLLVVLTEEWLPVAHAAERLSEMAYDAPFFFIAEPAT